jgi:membrane peptidoglycan carboxypeptidase
MQPHRSFVSPLNRTDIRLRPRRVAVLPTLPVVALIGWMALAAVPQQLVGADSRTPVPSIASTSLSADQVVDNLVRRNLERAQALQHSEGTRVYRLTYRGFPGDRDAEMTVKATYDSPCSKEFKVVSESGSKLILNRVFKKLMEGEQEAAQPAINARTQLNRDNYDFELLGYEPSNTGGQYVFLVNPKSHSKYVYRGKVWVDGIDFAVTRIEAEPTQNPSFWTKKSEIHHEYKKVGPFWLPARNESVSYVRLGGRATLTIEYTDYRVTVAGQRAQP